MGRVDLQNESLVELIRDHEWGTFSPFLLSHSVNDLPDEMLLSIFEYLSLHELVVKYSKTCLQWRDIIAQFILRTKILRLAKTNGLFKREIQQEGWTEEDQESEFILSLYPKYEFHSSKLHFQFYILSKITNLY